MTVKNLVGSEHSLKIIAKVLVEQPGYTRSVNDFTTYWTLQFIGNKKGINMIWNKNKHLYSVFISVHVCRRVNKAI